MLKDITLGQFFPGNSAVHRLDPRVKIVLTVAFIVLLFLAQGPVSYALIIAFLAVVIGISRISPKMVLRGSIYSIHRAPTFSSGTSCTSVWKALSWPFSWCCA